MLHSHRSWNLHWTVLRNKSVLGLVCIKVALKPMQSDRHTPSKNDEIEDDAKAVEIFRATVASTARGESNGGAQQRKFKKLDGRDNNTILNPEESKPAARTIP